MQKLSRAQQEKELEAKYLGQVVSVCLIDGTTLAAKVVRIAFFPEKGQELVHAQIGNKSFKFDLEYFEENTTIL